MKNKIVSIMGSFLASIRQIGIVSLFSKNKIKFLIN